MSFFVNGHCSNGFGIADEEDGFVSDNEKGKGKLVCGTTKEKHKAKNLKTIMKSIRMQGYMRATVLFSLRYARFCRLLHNLVVNLRF